MNRQIYQSFYVWLIHVVTEDGVWRLRFVHFHCCYGYQIGFNSDSFLVFPLLGTHIKRDQDMLLLTLVHLYNDII